MDQFTVTILQHPNVWTNFALLTDHIGLFTLLFVLAVFITSLIKRKKYGNQLLSVKNALGFAIAHLVLTSGTLLLAAIITPISMIKMGGASFLISSLLLVCLLSAFCSWFYGAWLGRAERDQLIKLDLPVSLLALTAVILS